MIDLHTHSFYSDGTFSPQELVRLAQKEGITTLALTDHDTLSGLNEAELEAQKQGISFIRGIELSVFDEKQNSFHILGYKMQNLDALLPILEEIKQSREERMRAMLSKMKDESEISVSYEALAEFCHGTIGSGNLAQYMVFQKFFKNFKEADTFIKKFKGKPYGVFVKQAVEGIHQAGGLAFLAHPYVLKDDSILSRLKEIGFDGLEYAHSNHSAEQTAFYLDLANKAGMLLSAGSDFHGAYKPDVHLGVGKGNHPLSDKNMMNWL